MSITKPDPDKDNKKPWHNKWYIWFIIASVLVILICSIAFIIDRHRHETARKLDFVWRSLDVLTNHSNNTNFDDFIHGEMSREEAINFLTDINNGNICDKYKSIIPLISDKTLSNYCKTYRIHHNK